MLPGVLSGSSGARQAHDVSQPSRKPVHEEADCFTAVVYIQGDRFRYADEGLEFVLHPIPMVDPHGGW